MVLQINRVFLETGQQRNIEIDILSAFQPFFYENFADFDRVLSVSDESGTYKNREWHDLYPKLNLTGIVLLRKVPILYRIGKNTQPEAHVWKKIPSMTRVKIDPRGRGGGAHFFVEKNPSYAD